MLERVLEPEVMDTAEEAHDYNAMDHAGVNQQFVADLLEFSANSDRTIASVLDLGTGTALIPIALCQQLLTCKVIAVDLAEHMLKIGQENIEKKQLTNRIKLAKADAKRLQYADGQFDCVVSNSIIHHIPQPASCVNEIVRTTSSGGVIFVRDLLRPHSNADVRQIVSNYAGHENEHSQQMFDDSLRAALSLDEIRGLVAAAGLDAAHVKATSDRHWTWSCVKP